MGNTILFGAFAGIAVVLAIRAYASPLGVPFEEPGRQHGGVRRSAVSVKVADGCHRTGP